MESDTSEHEPSWIEGNTSDRDTTVYYVSVNGNNDSSGTSADKPFRTLAKAFQTVRPGGKILIMPGTYSESLGIQKCGSIQDSILISGIGTPILDGLQQMAMGIFCETCYGLIFENLIIQNYTDIGIGISTCENMILRNLIIRENGYTVQLTDWEIEGYGLHAENSKNINISYNDVYRNGPEPRIFPDYLMGSGINTYGNENVIISHNRSFQNIGGGILAEDSENIIVEHNECCQNNCDASADEWWDAGIWLDGGRNVIVRNNVFQATLGAGIEISDEDNQDPYGYILENNLSTENYFGIYIWNFGTTEWPVTSVIRHSGNQFVNNSRIDLWIEQ